MASKSRGVGGGSGLASNGMRGIVVMSLGRRYCTEVIRAGGGILPRLQGPRVFELANGIAFVVMPGARN